MAAAYIPRKAPPLAPINQEVKAAAAAAAATATAAATAALHVGGMTCASCVGALEKALRALRGVRSVSVALMTERAKVRPGLVRGTGDTPSCQN